MKRTAGFISFVVIILALMIISSCGGGSSKNATAPISKLKTRAFISDSFESSTSAHNAVEIIDYSRDGLTGFSISLNGSGAGQMIASPRTPTVVFTVLDNGLSWIDNSKETEIGHVRLGGASESIVVTSDGKTAYAAIRSSNQIVAVDLASGTTSTIAILGVSRLVLSHNNAKILAFSDDVNTLTVVNTADNSTTTVSGFDRPTNAVFTADDSKAYVLSCGRECGGVTANVTVLDMSSNIPGANVTNGIAGGATVGLLDNSGNLLVAGSPPAGVAQLSIINASALTISRTINIGDGFHSLMTSASSNKLFLGARTCTTGCLSIVDTSAGTAVVDTVAPGQTPKGNVTGIAPIPNRNIVYVAEGGKLRIYDTTNSAETSASPLLITGTIGGVKVVDQ